MLILNRDKLKTANSFVLTLQKESALDNNNSTRRVNIRNIIALDDFSKKKYENVTIEINGKSDLNNLKMILKDNGDTRIKIKVHRNSKIYTFLLKTPRKFDLKTFNTIKDKEYVKKVSF